MDTSFFIECSHKKHGNKYDYTKTVYGKDNTEKVCIICPEHGEFWQSPREHLSGCGCPKCGKEKSAKNRILCIEEYIKRANEIHQNKYDYSKAEYSKLKDKICIICPEHGEFWQEAFSHLSGCGCPKCGKFFRKEKFLLKNI
jgi:flavorubredoxin